MTSNDLGRRTVPADLDWWHRDHPTFSALAGYFTGLLFVLLVPAAFVAVVGLLAGRERVEALFPFVPLTLIVPLGLLGSSRTRRFGRYMWLGIATTAFVVVGVGALVLWILVSSES
jgi:hypothetical protein